MREKERKEYTYSNNSNITDILVSIILGTGDSFRMKLIGKYSQRSEASRHERIFISSL